MGLLRGKRKNFWARQAMVPTVNGQAAGEHAAKARRWRRLVRANFIAFPFAILALMMALSQLINVQADKQTQVSGDGVPTAVRAQALDTVSDWLGSDRSPLSEATVAGWDGAEKLEWPKSSDEKDRTYEVWVAHVLVSTSSNVYVAGVQITVGDDGASVAGAPSLETVPSGDRESMSEGAQWPGTDVTPASDSVTRAVQAWAEAYTSGDPVRLATVVADPDTSHSYTPISGFTKVTATINSAAYHAHKKGSDPDESQMMARVTLAVDRDGLSQPAQLAFDLLVTDPTSGSAKIAAWGAPGSGPTLTPYANAITTSDTENAATPGATPIPGGAPTPGGTGTPAPSTTTTPTPTATKTKEH
jgi:hypothetical protein